MKMTFHPAKHSWPILWAAQMLNAFDLVLHNALHLEPSDLKRLKNIPYGAGLILAANHADEMDIRIFMEVSRRSKRIFTYMINSEAFEEWHGIGGWWLQRLGGFSVEKGAGDQAAKKYAVNTIKAGKQALVIFPEGEIFYLNDLVQSFKSGAVHMGLQAVTEGCQTRPDWTVYLVPVALKYCYRRDIEKVLLKKILTMEKQLTIRKNYLTGQERLLKIMAELLKRQQPFEPLKRNAEKLETLKEQVLEARKEILSRIETKYQRTPADSQTRLAERAQKMIFFLRKQPSGEKTSSVRPTERREDMKDLKRTIEMAGWQPNYTEHDPSEERLAETVMKLEREVYRKSRPRPLGNREVFVRIGSPVDLRTYVESYQKDPVTTSHQIALELQNRVQALIEDLSVSKAA